MTKMITYLLKDKQPWTDTFQKKCLFPHVECKWRYFLNEVPKCASCQCDYWHSELLKELKVTFDLE